MSTIPRLRILRGAPASGKTEIAKKILSKLKGKVAYIPIDDLQHFDRRTSASKDKLCLGVHHAALLASSFLNEGFDVVVEYVFDEDLGRFIDSVCKRKTEGLSFGLQVFFLDADIKVLLKRNGKRENPMPDDILEKLHGRIRGTTGQFGYEQVIATDTTGFSPKKVAELILQNDDCMEIVG